MDSLRLRFLRTPRRIRREEPVAPEGHDPELPVTRQKAEEWALVLASRGLHCRVAQSGAGRQVLAASTAAERARRELTLFERENAASPTPPDQPEPLPDNARETLLILSLLFVFYVLSSTPLPGLGLYPGDWRDAGAADAGLILSGQWWRVVTALTLHADPAHVLSNVVIGGVFAVMACKRLGLGLGWLAVVCSGALGNLANALAQSPSHLSVGFSTAVFGAAGLLAAGRPAPGGGRSPGRGSRWVPLAAGLALLALLGVGGERTDVGAHVFGFGAGLALGAATRLLLGARPGAPWQAACGLGAFGIVAAAWLAAFSGPGA